MSAGDLLVGAVIALLMIGAVYVLWKDHRKGKCSCGCNSSCCSKAGSCGLNKVTIEEDGPCDHCKKD